MDDVADRDISADAIDHVLKNLFRPCAFAKTHNGTKNSVCADFYRLDDSDNIAAVVVAQQIGTAVQAPLPHCGCSAVQYLDAPPALIWRFAGKR